MFDRLIKRAEATKANVRQTLARGAGGDTEIVPEVLAHVRRFKGFECGCDWPADLLAPEECPVHPGALRRYELESVLNVNVTTVQQ